MDRISSAARKSLMPDAATDALRTTPVSMVQMCGPLIWGRLLKSRARTAKRFQTSRLCKRIFTTRRLRLESFDFIYSLGVLHHLPDPEGAFQKLLKFLKPGGEVQIYLYWKPEGQPLKKVMLAGVSALRKITARLPHRVQHAVAFPAALLAHLTLVWPYKILKQVPGLNGIAERMPMKQYAQYPFRVCVNDQLDRFSAPIENRYTQQETRDWMTRGGLEDVSVGSNYGWVATGRKAKGE